LCKWLSGGDEITKMVSALHVRVGVRLRVRLRVRVRVSVMLKSY